MSDYGRGTLESFVRHRLVLLADVRLYREALEQVLGRSREIEVVGSAPASEASFDLLAATRPDIVLLEANAARMPSVVQSIIAAVSEAKVVAIAVSDEEQEVLRCAEAGVAGCVSREASMDELTTTIIRVARGEFPCSARVAALLAHRISSLAAERVTHETTISLTGREREILRLIDEGLSNKEIAMRLGIGVSTVKNHVHHILAKTCASRRAQAAARLRSSYLERSGGIRGA